MNQSAKSKLQAKTTNDSASGIESLKRTVSTLRTQQQQQGD